MLKEVEKLMKSDPENTELLAQKLFADVEPRWLILPHS
jgi:hypothetical protein